jgi:prepilin-type N-terminal cleavage/methylation domain-containing protein
MAHARRNTGLTLVEMLLAVAIIAILATIMAVSTGSLRKAAQERLTVSTLGIISSALQQYNEFWGVYPPQIDTVATDLTVLANQQTVFAQAVGCPTPAQMTVPPHTLATLSTVIPDEVLYLRLYRTPVCRRLISGFASVSEKDTNTKSVKMALVYTPRAAVAPATGEIPTFVEWGAGAVDKKANQLSLYRFVDAWRQPLRYEYKPGDQFPVLTSDGPDGKPNTPDDIKSSGK